MLRPRNVVFVAGIMQRVALAASLSMVGVMSLAAPSGIGASDNSPKRVGLVEHEQRRLAQIDVAVEGPADQIANLTTGQFRVLVDGREVVPSAMDRLCSVLPAATDSVIPPEQTATSTPISRTSFLFYFDQRNMTLAGRQIALDVAGQLISKLIVNGSRAAIVSSGKRVETFANFTPSQAALTAALERIRSDSDQWDEYPSLESNREKEVQLAVQWGRESGCQRASTYQREELSRAYAAMDRFVSVLGRYAALDSPKVAIYFADTLRNYPGRHYLAGAGRSCEKREFSDELSFQTVHDQAATVGVKLYAVQAEGMTAPDISGVRRSRDVAERDAQGGLKNLTLETGGDAFLNGASAEQVARRIEGDGACVYVLNFDPAPFPEDKSLSVRVDVAAKDVRARTRTSMVIQSEAARRMTTLLAAFTAPEDVRDSARFRGEIVPLGVDNGKLRALVQASLPATTSVREVWDSGCPLFREERSATRRQDVFRRNSPECGW